MGTNTSCKDCCFATFENNTQVGCQAGRLEKFQQLGLVETYYEVDEEEMSRILKEELPAQEPPRKAGGLEYCSIQRICSLCRNVNDPWCESTQPEDRLDKARSEVRPKVFVVLHVPHEATPLQVLGSIQSLQNQTLKPVGVQVVLTSNVPRSSEVIGVIRKSGLEIPWNVTAVTERKEGRPVGRGRAVDLGLKDVQPTDCQYYCVLDAGAELPSDRLFLLDRALNERLERILLVDRAGPIGPLVQYKTHLMVGGNAEAEHNSARCDSVEDKIRIVAKDQSSEALIHQCWPT